MYADGLWSGPLTEHHTALMASGLLYELDFIGVGIVGTDANRRAVKKALPEYFHVVAEAGTGWEQVTHTALAKDLDEPSKILYTHTKGAANHRHDQENWRREMTDGVVYHWKDCVDLLDRYDAVGCRWRSDPWRHYSGTFWWATSSYVSTLAPISYVYRDDAEAWIGQGSRGGTHAEVDPNHPLFNIAVHSFGRTFVCKRTEYGHSYSNIVDIGEPIVGDEFVNFPATEGNRFITHLIERGATYSIKGNTIKVETIRSGPG